jgi:hypothetical protein
MTVVQLLICGGIILAGYALMQWPSGTLRKVGVLFFCAASGLGVFFLSGQWWLGMGVVIGWILFPISELIYVLRKLRVPRTRVLEAVNRSPVQFDDLHLFTRDLADLGFRQVEDCEWYSPMHTQFYRLFVHESQAYHAGVSYIYNDQLGFHFLSFSSQDTQGRIWVTWDYPLTYGLKMPPEVALYRALDCATPAQSSTRNSSRSMESKKISFSLPSRPMRHADGWIRLFTSNWNTTLPKAFSRRNRYRRKVSVILGGELFTSRARFCGTWCDCKDAANTIVAEIKS